MSNRYLLEESLQEIWNEALSTLALSEAKLISISQLDLFRRVYRKDNRVYKIVLVSRETTSQLRSLDLAGEFKIMRSCAGISGISAAIDYYRVGDYETLVLENIEGFTLASNTPNSPRFCLIIVRLSVILSRLSLLGISHNDILLTNILIASDGRIWLIDFDQATQGTVLGAFARNFVGLPRNTGDVHYSLLVLIIQWLNQTLPSVVVRILKRFLKRGDDSVIQLVKLPDDAGPNLKQLYEAWMLGQRSNASAPGHSIAYYSLDFEGFHLPGERPWLERWDVLRQLTDYSGKRILELGCNMALLSCFLIKEQQASAVLAVDADSDVLKAARLVASAFDVTPKLVQKNFDAPEPWEEDLAAFEPDVVFALNIINWVKDKARFMVFLAHFDEVIFEGHNSIETETKRFEDVGFRHVDVVGLSERGRPILRCLK